MWVDELIDRLLYLVAFHNRLHYHALVGFDEVGDENDDFDGDDDADDDADADDDDGSYTRRRLQIVTGYNFAIARARAAVEYATTADYTLGNTLQVRVHLDILACKALECIVQQL